MITDITILDPLVAIAVALNILVTGYKLMRVAAIVIIYHAIDDIATGTVLKSLNIGVTVIAGAGVINLLLGFYLVKTGKKTDSLTLIADGKHILTDSVTSLGVLVGILIVVFL
jgi:divalent metal cation (Fe/Co/Zn/Cd) transporter